MANLNKVPTIQPETPKKEAKLEIIRDYYGKVDPFYLSRKDPNYVYRFLRDDNKNISIKTGNMLFQKGAWELVGRDHLRDLGITDRFISPDGLYRAGDTILARIPKDLYDEKVEYKRNIANEPMTAINRLMKEGNPAEGGRELHDSMKGIQTAKQLGLD